MSVAILNDEGGEWVGVYVDGDLKAEGHSLDPRMVLEALGHDPELLIADLAALGEPCPPTLSEARELASRKWR